MKYDPCEHGMLHILKQIVRLLAEIIANIKDEMFWKMDEMNKPNCAEGCKSINYRVSKLTELGTCDYSGYLYDDIIFMHLLSSEIDRGAV